MIYSKTWGSHTALFIHYNYKHTILCTEIPVNILHFACQGKRIQVSATSVGPKNVQSNNGTLEWRCFVFPDMRECITGPMADEMNETVQLCKSPKVEEYWHSRRRNRVGTYRDTKRSRMCNCVGGYQNKNASSGESAPYPVGPKRSCLQLTASSCDPKHAVPDTRIFRRIVK